VIRNAIGGVLLVVGLLGHLLAANAEGGRAIHYRHHVLGFLMLTVASGVVVAVLGRIWWRGRHDITLLIVGALQAAIGLLVYVTFSSQ
jgi:hypothetical protein